MLSIDPRVTIVGLLVGVFIGISGVGGGSLVTPLLLFMGIKPIVAVGTDLLYSVPTKLLGAFVHHRQRTVEWRLVRYLTTGGIPAAVVGLLVLDYLQHHYGVSTLNLWLRHGLGVTLIGVSIMLVMTPILSRRVSGAPETAIAWTGASIARIVGLGAVVGFMVSLTSIGSGSLTVPLLYLLIPQLGLRRLVGSDVAFAAILIPVAAAGHLQLGHVNLSLAASLLIGSLPGVTIGSRLLGHFPTIWLRPALAVILVFAGVTLARA